MHSPCRDELHRLPTKRLCDRSAIPLCSSANLPYSSTRIMRYFFISVFTMKITELQSLDCANIQISLNFEHFSSRSGFVFVNAPEKEPFKVTSVISKQQRRASILLLQPSRNFRAVTAAIHGTFTGGGENVSIVNRVTLNYSCQPSKLPVSIKSINKQRIRQRTERKQGSSRPSLLSTRPRSPSLLYCREQLLV